MWPQEYCRASFIRKLQLLCASLLTQSSCKRSLTVFIFTSLHQSGSRQLEHGRAWGPQCLLSSICPLSGVYTLPFQEMYSTSLSSIDIVIIYSRKASGKIPLGWQYAVALPRAQGWDLPAPH